MDEKSVWMIMMIIVDAERERKRMDLIEYTSLHYIKIQYKSNK